MSEEQTWTDVNLLAVPLRHAFTEWILYIMYVQVEYCTNTSTLYKLKHVDLWSSNVALQVQATAMHANETSIIRVSLNEA
jgi:hypothetical protein